MSISLRHSRQKGTSLIEVVIALFTLTIGLLGTAAMQTKTLQFNQSAYLRTQATVLAGDIIDRMRANSNELQSYSITLAQTPSLPSNDCTLTPCNAMQMAAYDTHQWIETIEKRLPEGDGEITHLGNDLFRVTIRWRDRDNDTRTFNVETQL